MLNYAGIIYQGLVGFPPPSLVCFSVSSMQVHALCINVCPREVFTNVYTEKHLHMLILCLLTCGFVSCMGITVVSPCFSSLYH